MYPINLIEYFNNTVIANHNKVAVTDGTREITFAQLDKKVQSLGSHLTNISTSSVVAVFLKKSIEAVVCDIAITSSGNAYMNLDIKNPSERLRNILNLVKPSVIITDSENKEKIEPLISEKCQLIDINSFDFDAYSGKCEAWQNAIDTDLYCVINTSGSTGTPKAVALNHRSFIDFMEQTIPMYNFSADDTIGSLSPVIFDIWSYELCLLMGVGARIVVIPDTLSAFPVKILQLMQQEKVSYIFWVPTIMVNIANMRLLEKISLPDLRLVWFAGEVFPTKQFNIWYHALPHTRFSNYYGPIEITLDCIYYDIDKEISDNEPIPIGRPFRNTSILLINSENNLVSEPFEEGEICVRGSSLALGYFNNSEKTAAAFVQNPLNNHYPELIYRTGDIGCYNNEGLILFKGRKDTLIKHMGYRIELGEIEHVIINTLKIVRNGCVVYNSQKKEITLFYEADEEKQPAEFRKLIGNALPRYMVPVAYHHLSEMQRNPNGKIDRAFYNNSIKEDSIY